MYLPGLPFTEATQLKQRGLFRSSARPHQTRSNLLLDDLKTCLQEEHLAVDPIGYQPASVKDLCWGGHRQVWHNRPRGNKQPFPILPASAHMKLPGDFYLLLPSNRGFTLLHPMSCCQHIVLLYLHHVHHIPTFHISINGCFSCS